MPAMPETLACRHLRQPRPHRLHLAAAHHRSVSLRVLQDRAGRRDAGGHLARHRGAQQGRGRPVLRHQHAGGARDGGRRLRYRRARRRADQSVARRRQCAADDPRSRGRAEGEGVDQRFGAGRGRQGARLQEGGGGAALRGQGYRPHRRLRRCISAARFWARPAGARRSIRSAASRAMPRSTWGAS